MFADAWVRALQSGVHGSRWKRPRRTLDSCSWIRIGSRAGRELRVTSYELQACLSREAEMAAADAAAAELSAARNETEGFVTCNL